ncbi:MAG: ATPase [Bacteroidota bacterium]
MNFLCISCYFKGNAFLKALKEQGNTVYLLTLKTLEYENWVRDHIDEFFYMDSDANSPENLGNLGKGLAWMMRSRKIDRIVALDDFDVEKAAFLREQFRIPGMGQTTVRYFRDKLAMRMKAAESRIHVPTFTSLFNDADINHYADNVPAPWILKPRSEASATGMKKIHSKEELWQVLNSTGEERHKYLLERFTPGDVYHADALTVDGKVEFVRTSRYLNTPLEVAHGGGIFRTATLEFGSTEDRQLREMNEQVLEAFGMQFSASHTEFIRSRENGEFYFLETSSRVGGAHIAEMVEISSGISLWAEWAKIETAMARGQQYHLPEVQHQYAGILVSLARQQHPDMSSFNDPEIAWRIQKDYHIGMIVRSERRERVIELLDNYVPRVYRDFHASAPADDELSHS